MNKIILTTTLLTKLSPIINTLVILAIAYSFIVGIINGNFKKMVLQVVISSIIAYLIHDPDSLYQFGNFLITTSKNFGGDIFGN